jgi:hypothetical protein
MCRTLIVIIHIVIHRYNYCAATGERITVAGANLTTKRTVLRYANVPHQRMGYLVHIIYQSFHRARNVHVDMSRVTRRVPGRFLKTRRDSSGTPTDPSPVTIDFKSNYEPCEMPIRVCSLMQSFTFCFVFFIFCFILLFLLFILGFALYSLCVMSFVACLALCVVLCLRVDSYFV